MTDEVVAPDPAVIEQNTSGVVGVLAEALAQHQWRGSFLGCRCGWNWSEPLTHGCGEDERIARAHREHVASVVAALPNIAGLVAAVRESERALEAQKKVADTFRQCLTDTYRPHVEENKQLLDLVSHYDSAVRERDNTITRVRDIIESVHQSDGLDPDGYQVAGLIRAALDPQETP